MLEEGRRASLTVSLFHALHTSQLQQGLAPRLMWRHPSAQIVGDVQGEMTLEFVRHLLFAPGLAEESAKPHHPRSQSLHAGSSSGARKRATIVVASFHCRASRSSCFRPARVNL